MLLRICKRHKFILFLLLWLPSVIVAQQKMINGRIISKNDQNPVAGASVILKGTKTGTSTSVDGKFSLPGSPGDVLVISGVGVMPTEYTVGDQKDFSLEVEQDAKKMNEVVVTALGIRKEVKKLGYAIQEVKGSELIKAREPNPINGLAGKVAGLNVGVTQEMLGQPVVLLRGNQLTLYVVDGIPINSDTYNISPDDIESYTILKGPAAAALYGSRGFNGAIIITTKKGKRTAKGFSVEVNTSFQVNKGFIAIPKVQNIYGGGDNQKYAFGDGAGGGFNDGDYDVWGHKMNGQLLPQYDGKFDPTQTYTTTFQDGTTYTGHIEPTPWLPRGANNMEGFIQSGLLNTNNVSFSSVTDKSNVRLSISNSNQRGIVPNTQLNAVNFNLFAGYDITPKLRVEGNVNYNRQMSPNVPDVNYGPNSIVYNIDIWTGADWNIDQVRDYWQPGKEGIQSKFVEYKRYHNPWFESYEWLRSHQKNDLYGWLSLSYKINKNLDALVRTNVTTYNIFRSEKLPFSAHPYGEEHNHGNYREDHRDLFENNTEVMLKYNSEIGNSGITIGGFVGGNIRSFKYNSNFTTTNQLIVPEVYTFTNTLNPLKSYNFGSNMIVYSGYYSLDVGIGKWLILGTTGRVDKSSALPLTNDTYFYPSFSAASVISDYVQLPKSITFLKVRANYSNVKDGGTSPYISTTPLQTYPIGYGGDYLSTYSGPIYNLTRPYSTSPTYNNQTGAYAPTSSVDPNIKPVSRTNFEAGLDVRFLNNRLGLSATYFQYKNGPQQYNKPLSETSGLIGYTLNGFETKRSGGEISLQGTPIANTASGGLRWDVVVNWSTYKEVYTAFAPGQTVYNQFFHIGDRVDNLYGNVEAKTEDGRVIVDPSGKVLYYPVAQFVGHGDPDWSWAVINKFNYKSFTLSFQFDGMVGGKIQDYVKRKLFEGGRGEETVEGKIGEARQYEFDHFGDAGYKGAVDASGNPILGADQVQVTSGTITYDPVTGLINNYKELQFGPNKTATKWVQDYVSSFYNDPEHTMVNKTYAKLRELVITYNFPQNMLKKTFITKAEISLIGRNLLYFFPKAFHDIDVDQYPGRDIYNNANREYNLQTPTTRSYGVNLNITF